MTTAISHQDNFGTNLTTNTNTGDTTTPLNSIPSVDAPFWIAFDATNTNSHYERKLVTSKTATNVNHSALAYAHTTAEEVRLVNPSEEFDAIYQGPQGYLINGKITVTDVAGITVAIKTLAGADPSETDPVYIRIGNTPHVLTAALSVAKADGTNWFNAGSAELATKEIDYFVYLGYNATNGVTLGFSRIPSACQYSDFSVTTTNEKYAAISTITNAAATDYYENVGRFAATLSAGAGYTWSVPTFTAKNLIQKPINYTRMLTAIPVYTGFTANTPGGTIGYQIMGSRLFLELNIVQAGTSNATGFTFTLPMSLGATAARGEGAFAVVDAGVNVMGWAYVISAGPTAVTLGKSVRGGAFTSSGDKYAYGTLNYIIE